MNLIFITPLFYFAQEFDSIMNHYEFEIQDSKVDTIKINDFEKLSKQFLFYKEEVNKEELKKYKRLLLENLSRSKKSSFKIRKSLQYLVFYHLRYKKIYDSALFYIKEKQKYSSEPSSLASDYIMFAETYIAKQEYETAFSYYTKALDIYDSIEDYFEVNKIKLKIGMKYLYLEDTIRGKSYLHEVINNTKPNSFKEVKQLVDANFFLAESSSNKDSIEYYLEESLNLMNSREEYSKNGGFILFSKIFVLSRLIEENILNNQHDKAKRYIDSIEYYKNYVPKELLHSYYSSKAYFERYILKGDKDSIKQFYNKSILLCLECDEETLIGYHLNYLDFLLEDKKMTKAIELLNAIDSMYLNIISSKKTKALTKFTTKLDVEFKEQKIKNLELENKISNLKISTRNKVIISVFVIFIILTLLLFFILKNKKSIAENKKLKSRRALLQSIITPHFMANSLGSIQGLIISENKDHAVDIIGDLGVIMRMVFDFSQKDKITLIEELQFLKKYLKLKKERHPELEINLINKIKEEKGSNIFISPMMLQPIIENSIKYGKELNNKVNVEIILTIKQNKINAKISNFGKYNSLSKNQESSIKVIKERLQNLEKLHESYFDFKIEEVNKEVIVNIELPYEEIIDL